MASDKVKIYYFPIRGRAEAIRLMCEAHNIPYEDVVVTKDDFIPKYKSNTELLPFGQLPVIEHGDLKLAQSNAILRYLGRVSKSYGSDPKNDAFIDMILDGTEDLRQVYLKVVYGPTYEESKKQYVEETLPKFLTVFERLLKQKGENFFGGDVFSPADASLHEQIDISLRLDKNALEKYPVMAAWFKRCASLEPIDKYLKSGKRPEMINGSGKGQ